MQIDFAGISMPPSSNGPVAIRPMAQAGGYNRSASAKIISAYRRLRNVRQLRRAIA